MNTFTIITVIVGVILSLVSVNYARKTYKKDYLDKSNEEKLHLLTQFKATQTLSNRVYGDLYNYAERNNAFDQFMWSGITYRSYLLEMKKSQSENLSVELFEKIKTSNLPSLTIQSMCKSLETQFENLTLIHQEVKLRIHNI